MRAPSRLLLCSQFSSSAGTVSAATTPTDFRSPIAARRKWESNLSDFLSERRKTRSEVLVSRFNDIYRKQDFTPVEEVFPNSAFESKRWTGHHKERNQQQQHQQRRSGSGGEEQGKREREQEERFQTSQQKKVEELSRKKQEFAERRKKHAAAASCAVFDDPHVCRVAMIGPTNAGKSTLLNTMVTSHVSAESRRAGTTIDWLKGVTHVHDTQLQLLDTPGIYIPATERKARGKNYLNRQLPLSLAAWDSLFCANVVLLTLPVNGAGFLDPTRKQLLRELHRRCRARELPIVLAMTKLDLLRDTEKNLLLYRHLRSDIDSLRIPFAETCEVSAKLYKGIVDLKDTLASFAVPKPWEFPKSDVTDLNQADRVNEIVREAFFQHLPHQIPHLVSHKIVGWTKGEESSTGNKLTKVIVEVFFDRPSFMHTFFSKQLEIAQTAREQTKVVLKENVWFHFQSFISPVGKNQV